jgi:hypothetical protein
MRRNLIDAGYRFVAVLVLLIGLSSYGCKDTTSISEEVEVPLSSLTVTPGSLQPAFFSNTTNYWVNAPTSATSVTVTAIPKDNTVTVTINGVVTTQRSISLGPPGSTTTIVIALSSQTGGETTYTVNVTRLLSSDNNLSTLNVTPGPLAPPFLSDTLDYTVDVATNIASVTVSATKSDPTAVMLIESILISPITVPAGTPSSGPVNIPLTGPGTNTVVSISVTAPNGSKETYTITVRRAASSDYNLSALSVTPGSLTPPFDPNHLTYTVEVATEITEVIVTATKSDPNAVLSGSIADPGAGVATGQRTIPLLGAGTSTPISITVIAQDGTPRPSPYVITVNRAAPAAPPAPPSAPDLIPEDDSCLRDPVTTACVPPTSDTDDITNVTTPRFRISPPGTGQTPSLYIDGTKDTAATFDSAANTLRPSTALSDGNHSITSTVTNTATTLESAQSPPLTVTIDTTAP